MTLLKLLEIVLERGIELYADGESLHFRAREGVLDDFLLVELRSHKQAILAALRNSPSTIFYEDSGEVWYQDAAGRFWYADKATGSRSELIPGNPPDGTPLPREFFIAFGKLLGHVICRRLQ